MELPLKQQLGSYSQTGKFLDDEATIMDEALAAIYDGTAGESGLGQQQRWSRR